MVLSITRDVTEWKKNERRYRLLADNSLDVIWTLNLETLGYTYVSPAIGRLRGLTVEQALAEPLEASFTPESLARAGDVMSRATGPDGASTYTGVFDQPCADGSIKHVEITASYVRNENGRPVEILGVSRDATARVDAERALRESEARFRTLIERSTDMIVLLDGEARITFWSHGATEALGWEPGDLQGKGLPRPGPPRRPGRRCRDGEATSGGGQGPPRASPCASSTRTGTGEASTAPVGISSPIRPSGRSC